MSRIVHRSVFLRRARLDMTTGRVVYALGALHGVVSELDARVTCAESVWASLRVTPRPGPAPPARASSPGPRRNLVFRCAPVEPGVCAGRALGRPGLDLRGCDAVLVLNLRRPRADAPLLVPAAELEYTLTCDAAGGPAEDTAEGRAEGLARVHLQGEGTEDVQHQQAADDAMDAAACLDVD